jgi:hypothetical protein
MDNATQVDAAGSFGQGERPAGRKLYGQLLRHGVSSRDSGRGGNQTGEDSTDVVTDDQESSL